MSLESVSRLHDLTGIDRRTIKKRLNSLKPIKEGRSHLYESREAIPLLFGIGVQGSGEYNLESEKARLAHHQANKASMEERALQGKLVPIEMVKAVHTGIVRTTRAKILTLPTKVAHSVLGLSELNQAKTVLKAAVYDTLTELTEYKPVIYEVEAELPSKAAGDRASVDG